MTNTNIVKDVEYFRFYEMAKEVFPVEWYKEEQMFRLIPINNLDNNQRLWLNVAVLHVWDKYRCEKKITHLAVGFEGEDIIGYVILHDRKAKGVLREPLSLLYGKMVVSMMLVKLSEL